MLVLSSALADPNILTGRGIIRMMICAGSMTITFDQTSGQRSYCRGRESKLSNSAAEQTGLGNYMASKLDCKGVGIVGN